MGLLGSDGPLTCYACGAAVAYAVIEPSPDVATHHVSSSVTECPSCGSVSSDWVLKAIARKRRLPLDTLPRPE